MKFCGIKKTTQNTCYSLSRFESGLHTLKTKICYGIKSDVPACINKLIFHDVTCRKKGDKMSTLAIFI